MVPLPVVPTKALVVGIGFAILFFTVVGLFSSLWYFFLEGFYV